jgi:hypothetical protein
MNTCRGACAITGAHQSTSVSRPVYKRQQQQQQQHNRQVQPKLCQWAAKAVDDMNAVVAATVTRMTHLAHKPTDPVQHVLLTLLLQIVTLMCLDV